MTIRILCGDTREILKTLPGSSVQCVVTSPPYFGLRSYLPDGHEHKHKEIGIEQTPAEYVEQMVAVFREVRRALRDDGTVWLNLGDSYNTSNNRRSASAYVDGGTKRLECQEPNRKSAQRADIMLKEKDMMMIPARVALALQADGWWLRSDIIWAKPNPMPESVTDRPTSAHEHVFLLAKRERYFFDAEAVREPVSESTLERWNGTPQRKNPSSQGLNVASVTGESCMGVGANGRNIRNVWTIATAPYAEAHFATFPPELAERCIKAGTSERGCCANCGAPWARITTKGESDRAHQLACGGDAAGEYRGQSIKGHDAAGVQNASDVKRRILEGMREKTFDWQPSCACDAATTPCTVLDPFGGAGTTALVADRLGRNAILIELNQQYCDLARNRLTKDAGLFAEVAA